jgi:hypothetical protein
MHYNQGYAIVHLRGSGMNRNDLDTNLRRGAGGTPGGLLEFFIGLGMIILGGYLFFNNLMVTSSMGVLWGRGGSGVALLVLLVGIAVLFFSGRSWLGWILVVVGLGAIFISVISNLTIYFRPNSFLNTLIMLGLIFGGLGLVARALRAH